jgi:hypothetical protein
MKEKKMIKLSDERIQAIGEDGCFFPDPLERVFPSIPVPSEKKIFISRAPNGAISTGSPLIDVN